MMDTRNLEDSSNQFIVTVKDTKTDYPRQFVIGGEYYDIVKKYVLLRPDNMPSHRFFVSYYSGKCTKQFIGKNKISETLKTIASYLNLDNPSDYTGHCFRRSSATAAANARLDFTKIKQLGGWKSDAVAQGYIENSVANREDIFKRIANPYKVQDSMNSDKQLPASSKSGENNLNGMALSKSSSNSSTYAKAGLQLPSTSTENSNRTTNDNNNNSMRNNVPPIKPLSVFRIRRPLQEVTLNNNEYISSDEPKSKKRKQVIENEVIDSVSPTSVPVLFQNCEIHKLIINNNYCNNINEEANDL